VSGGLPPLPELADLDLLVVQDVVLSAAAQRAHVVLPLATFAEIDGTLTNLEGRVQRLRPAVRPPGQARPGWTIVRDLARKMTGTTDDGSSGHWAFDSAADVMAEIASLVPAYAGVDLDGLGVEGVVRRFPAAGEHLLAPFRPEDVPPLTSAELPLTLITEHNLHYYYGVCLTEDVKGMKVIRSEQVLHVNPVDASRMGIADGDLVRAVSVYGGAECLAKVDRSVPPGTVFGSFNRLVGCELFADLSPATKAIAIRIERARG
jgi:predicted molibdopterin-dependent oxidoreductase YjgC